MSRNYVKTVISFDMINAFYVILHTNICKSSPSFISSDFYFINNSHGKSIHSCSHTYKGLLWPTFLCLTTSDILKKLNDVSKKSIISVGMYHTNIIFEHGPDFQLLLLLCHWSLSSKSFQLRQQWIAHALLLKLYELSIEPHLNMGFTLALFQQDGMGI